MSPQRRPLPIRVHSRRALRVAWTIVPLMLTVTASTSPDFLLDDQFERPHRSSELFDGGPVLVLAGAQRETPDAMKRWEEALRPALPAEAGLYGLSNLKRLPFFVPKGAVRKTLREQLPDFPVLCDWKGKVYAALGFPAEATLVLGVFSGSGERLGTMTGEPTTDAVRQALALLRSQSADSN